MILFALFVVVPLTSDHCRWRSWRNRRANYEGRRRPTDGAGPSVRMPSRSVLARGWTRSIWRLSAGWGVLSAMSLSMRATRSAALSRSIAIGALPFLAEEKHSRQRDDCCVQFCTVSHECERGMTAAALMRNVSALPLVLAGAAAPHVRHLVCSLRWHGTRSSAYCLSRRCSVHGFAGWAPTDRPLSPRRGLTSIRWTAGVSY